MRPSTTSSPRPLPESPSVWRFEAIGTPWEIETLEPLDRTTTDAVTARVEQYDRAWSRFRDDSLVTRIAHSPGAHRLPPEAGPLLDLYRRLYLATDGAVSPLVGRALESLGYDRAYSLRPTASRAPVPRWEDAIAWDGEVLATARPVILDVGAAGKGQLVDLVLDVLTDHDVHDALVDASGDLRRRGPGSISIGLEHPADPTRVVGVVELADGAICASAANRRRWGDDLHHVLDATTGLPTRSVVATWALAPTALEADGLATALFFADGESLQSVTSFAWVRMLANGRIESSDDLPGEVFA